MEERELIIYLCIVLPIIPVIFALKDKYSRNFLIYTIIGLTVCLVSAQINTLLVQAFNIDMLNYSVSISPIIEEILKVIPIIYFVILFAKDDEQILPLAFAIGIGFGILESIVVYINSEVQLDVGWAIVRGLGASLMHSACTAMITIGISYEFHNKKCHLEGIIGLLSAAIIYHATFNVFVQSKYSIIALLMPLLLFVPINYIEYKKKKYFEDIEKEKLQVS